MSKLIQHALRIGLLALFGALLAPAAFAQTQEGNILPVTQAYKLSADAATPGVLKLHWVIAPDYYLYRGRMKFTAGPGITLGAAQMPAGTVEDDPYIGRVELYHHQTDATIPYTVAPGTTRLRVDVQYQGCHEVEPKICYPPHTEHLDLPLPRVAGAAAGTSGTGIDSSASAGPSGTPPAGGPLQTSLFAALALALGGGLILNLMPCVLPVLSIKAVGLLESAESPARRHRHALAYAAGVLVSFMALGAAIVALRAAGHTLGWGAQLQQPLLVAVLACVIFALGLAMSGVVQLGGSLGNLGSGLAARGGGAGSFFTGVLAVVVASPCTAPFMGAALAYAFVAPVVNSLLVFLALGIGLALPFVAIAYIPALARRLPKPGGWMETLKQVLAFPMYLTAAWLAWVLANQRGADAVGLLLVAMVLLALALWWFERSRGRGPLAHSFTAALAALVLLPLFLLTQVPATAAVARAGSVPYSVAKLAELRAAGTPVFVDMTADWCITCKANEHVVLDSTAFHDALARNDAVYMQGDWTNENPAITAFLQRFHSPGVPLYVVFPKGGGAGRQLPTVLTTALVTQALDEAGQ